MNNIASIDNKLNISRKELGTRAQYSWRRDKNTRAHRCRTAIFQRMASHIASIISYSLLHFQHVCCLAQHTKQYITTEYTISHNIIVFNNTICIFIYAYCSAILSNNFEPWNIMKIQNWTKISGNDAEPLGYENDILGPYYTHWISFLEHYKHQF